MTLNTLLNGNRLPLSGQYTLDLLQPSDMPAICTMLADEQVHRHLFFAPAPEQVFYDYFNPQFDAMSRAIAQGTPAKGPLMLALRDGQGKFAGMAALVPVEGEAGVYDIGYQLPVASWGQGLATAACRVLTQIAFDQLGAERVRADTYDSNQGSKRVLEKCGYGRTHKIYGHFEQGQIDQCWFAMTAAQYQRSARVAGDEMARRTPAAA
ncbi:GNAT family N-acetyltransferase [Ferrimonas marina]|uniref:Protein N-acetyltransferase, RimJ/RimL family n=1 Tax=Ferrimonas marina TaxID=299255 RepID=A0A1M5XWT3_9GAMM|nr:GNAT family N-acetyltransferase [Ferrimonas marina]SHI04206.1 Protein N-acetyltransferase, RimJ/RimL family [Ferrimonas marina]